MLEKNHDNFDENFVDIDQIDPSKKTFVDGGATTVKQPLVKSKDHTFMAKVYGYVALGLILAFGVSILYPIILWATCGIETTYLALGITSIVSIVALFVFTFIINFAVIRKGGTSLPFYIIYTVLMGLCLSPLILVYGLSTNDGLISLGITFGVTVGVFAIMALFAYILKDRVGLFVGPLVALSVATLILCLVNVFLFNEVIYWIVSFAIVFISMLFILIDVATIKKASNMGYQSKNEALFYSLILFSDFIRLFIYLLPIIFRIVASSRN